jgi:hypothetical protein
MTSNHKYFESLCALAISDELTGPELVELHAHSLECVSCRDRIHEMTKIDACLLLSPAFTRQNARLPKGMRERFIARAIKEGVPLNSPSTAGLGNLGLASALFIILLVTAAAIRTGPFSRPVVDASHFDAAQLANPVRVASLTPPGSTMNLRPGRKDRSRDARSRSVVFQWRPDPSSGFQARKSGALLGHLEPFQNRYFPATFSSPHYTLATMPSDLGRLSAWPDMPPRFRLAVPQPLIRENALLLLADSEHGTAKPMIIPSQFTFATPGAQGFHLALDIDPYRAHPIFEVGDTLLKFHFVEDVTQ